MAGPLRSADVAPFHRYCGPSRHPLVFGRFPGFAGYTAYLAPAISHRDEEGFSSFQHVFATVLSLPPRQGEQSYRSVFGCSCCLHPTVAGSALGDYSLSRPHRVIGIGGSLYRAAPLPHHPACGSAPGGSRS